MVDKIVFLCVKTAHMKMSFFVYFTHKINITLRRYYHKNIINIL
nr:MAG TPA: hypothetical protein [Bacteriophage sp.]